MKILHIITSLKIGGAEAALTAQLERWVTNDEHEHVVAYFYGGPHETALQRLGVRSFHLRGLVRGYDPIGFMQLLRLAQREKPAILHTALWTANQVGRLAGRLLGIPVISEFHGNPGHEGTLRNWCEQRTAHLSNSLVAVSHSVARQYRDAILPGIAAARRQQVDKKLIVIRNGIDLEKIPQLATANDQNKPSPHPFTIGSIGRFEPIKSYHVLIEAFALLLRQVEKPHDFRLLLIGDGSQRHRLEALVATLGLREHVIMTGFRSDAATFYPVMDCFALSSQSEGLSLGLLQALAHGLPVVTTHTESEHDAIEPGINGFLVPPNSPAALAEKLLQIYQLKRAGQLRSITLDASFDLARVCVAYENLYKQLGATGFR